MRIPLPDKIAFWFAICLFVAAVYIFPDWHNRAQASLPPKAEKATISQWLSLSLSQYGQIYTAKQGAPVIINLMHAKEDSERAYRVCGPAVGDGELMVVYGEEGEPMDFHNDQFSDMCATTYVSWGGGGMHENQLAVYLIQLKGRPAQIEWPEIKVGVAK